MHWLYLIIDLGCLVIPLAFTFHPRILFHKVWGAFFLSLLASASFFLIWDEYFTQSGFWGFNPRYLLGIYIGSLPLEEVLFFVCIPYACVFTYWALKQLKWVKYSFKKTRKILYVLASSSLLLAVFNTDKAYTFATFLLLSIFLFVLIFTRRDYLPLATISYVIILPFFFISNGLLTGCFIPEEVVWYNDQENLGIRIFSIPFEDAFYGLLLILMTIAGMEEILKRNQNKNLKLGN